jgi:hypothetical protein
MGVCRERAIGERWAKNGALVSRLLYVLTDGFVQLIALSRIDTVYLQWTMPEQTDGN